MSRPLQAFQILSWVCFGADILIFYLVLIPSVSLAVQLAGGIVFGLCALVVFACGWIASTTDPIDPIAFESGPYSPAPAPEVHPDMRECDVCGYVNERSKHCRVCNKCVDGFDHHCMWINNCVGDKNYRPFFVLLVATALMTAFVLVLATWCVVEEAVWTRPGERWRDAYGWYHRGAFFGLLAIPIVLNLPLIALVGQLLALHIYLVLHHLTTFEYITLRVHEEQEEQDPQSPGGEKQKKHRMWAEWIVIDRKRLRRAKKRGLMRDLSEVSQCTPIAPVERVASRELRDVARESRSRALSSETPKVSASVSEGQALQPVAPSPALHDSGGPASSPAAVPAAGRMEGVHV